LKHLKRGVNNNERFSSLPRTILSTGFDADSGVTSFTIARDNFFCSTKSGGYETQARRRFLSSISIPRHGFSFLSKIENPERKIGLKREGQLLVMPELAAPPFLHDETNVEEDRICFSTFFEVPTKEPRTFV